jgi:peptide/nickel transport system permease protein
MTKYVVRRVVQAVPVLIGITIVIYAIMLLAPGGPTVRFSQNNKVTNEQRLAFLKSWGLDQPIPVQYCRWLGACDPEQDGIALLTKKGLPNFLPTTLGGGTNGVLHGDLGYSLDTGESVGDRIGKSALPTLLLAGTALITWVTIAVLLGVLAALKPYSLFDQGATVFSYIGVAMPTFWLGLMLILLFSSSLRILPVSGMIDTRLSPPFGSDQYWIYFGKQPIAAIIDIVRHLILPVITLVVISIAGDSRFVRASMLEALSQDYVRTARAKGLPNRRVVFRHALRNALLPVVTNIGLEIPFLFSGAVVTESIFSWPGEGRLFINSIQGFDYTILMGILLIAAVLTVFANLLADVLYAVVDPRIKY